MALFQSLAQGQVHFEQLKSFGDLRTSGSSPIGPLCVGSDHTLYGTTYGGGGHGYGTVFKVEQDGSNYTLLHSFGQGKDGQAPDGGLIEATNGLMYGTTHYGGTNDDGSIYKLAKDGAAYQVRERTQWRPG